ncbi:MAG TPA: hypothetical protein PK295_02700 [Candidatus Magasanikbacteria bacterium]|nr:hypothetical protein [Candidatus Magasanikbacteria bacterium]
MDPSTSSPTPSQNQNVGPTMPAPLNLENAGFVGSMIIGYNRNAKPRTLGKVCRIKDHSQSSVLEVDGYGTFAIDRFAWQKGNVEGNRALIHPAPPEKQHYVRFDFMPVETPQAAS